MSVRVLRDIPFTKARVGWNEGRGPLSDMVLKLDAYLPERASREPRPALVLAFGGAFHRGSKEDDTNVDGAHRNTSTADYCRRFAEMGLPAFSLQYRLAQTDPEPGRRLLTEPDAMPMSRINPRRVEMNLPPISPRAMAQIIEAAIDDTCNAVQFVKMNAGEYGVDPARIVAGGFSAGGRCAMYAAYGHRLDVAGVISISGPLTPIDAKTFLAKGGKAPPLLMISGSADLDYVCAFTPDIEKQFRGAGREIEAVLVPGGTHFFQAEAGTLDGRPVLKVMTDALIRWFGPLPAVMRTS